MLLAHRVLMNALALLATACTSYGVIDNKPLLQSEGRPGYSIGEFARNLDRQFAGTSRSGQGELTIAAPLATQIALVLRRIMNEENDPNQQGSPFRLPS